MLPTAITEVLRLYLDEEAGRSALDTACSAAAGARLEIAELFDWLQRYDADRERKQRAQAALRHALGLPLIPGPPCRSN